MFKDWQTKKLGEVCEIYQPKTISKKEMILDGKYLVFGANGVIGKYDKYNHENSELLITCRGATCGSINISVPKSWINGNAMIIRPLNNEQLSKDYLRYFFSGIDLSSVITGAAQPQITRQTLSPFNISLPPLPEQHRIVKMLDEVFADVARAKTNAEKNLQNAKEIFVSYLQNVFANPGEDWQTKKLGEVCVIGAGNSAPQKKEFFIDGVYPFFRTSDIGQIHIGRITESSDYLNEKGIKGLKLFNKGTILLPKSGASTFLNHRVVLGLDGYVSSHLATVKTDEKVLNNSYLFYFLQEVKAQDLIQDHKYPSLNLPVIGNIEISYPESLPEQQRIVKKLDALSAETKKLEAIYQQKIDDLEELKRSVLKKAFSEEL